MARARKKRGFRAIVVDGVGYRWRLSPGAVDSVLRVSLADERGQTLNMRLVGWADPWLNLSGFRVEDDMLHLYTSARNAPAIITGKFVRQGIVYALSAGWTPDAPRGTFQVMYPYGEFSAQS